MINFGYGTFGFTDRNVELALDAIAAAGFEQAEVFGQEPHLAVPPKGRALREFGERLRERGLGATVHAPLTTNVLGAPDEQWRREKVYVLGEFLRFSGAIEARAMVVHPIPNPIFVADPEDPALPGLMGPAVRRSLDDLGPIAERAGVPILLENLPYDCDYPLLNMAELRPLVDEYPPAQVGLIIDTGHAVLTGLDPADEIRIAGERLLGTHLQDTDGLDDRHWLPGTGVIDWDAVREALVQVEYRGAWTFEMHPGPSGESPEDACSRARAVAEDWRDRLV